MEKKKEIKGYRDLKTNVRAVSDGVNLLTRHAGMLLKACGPLMLLVSVFLAWGLLKLLAPLSNAMLTGQTPEQWWTVALPFGLYEVGLLALLAMFYSQFQGYVTNGFIPQVTLRSIWKMTWKTLCHQTLIVWLWLLFMELLYAALMGYFAILTPYSLIATIPLGILLTFWCYNLLTDFHVQQGSLMRAITRSFSVTFKGFLSFLGTFILLMILMSVVGVIVTIPVLVSILVFHQSQTSIAMQDGSDLPGYFNAIFFIASLVSCFLLFVMDAIALSSWSMVYGAVSSRLQQKKESKKIKALAPVEEA